MEYIVSSSSLGSAMMYLARIIMKETSRPILGDDVEIVNGINRILIKVEKDNINNTSITEEIIKKALDLFKILASGQQLAYYSQSKHYTYESAEFHTCTEHQSDRDCRTCGGTHQGLWSETDPGRLRGYGADFVGTRLLGRSKKTVRATFRRRAKARTEGRIRASESYGPQYLSDIANGNDGHRHGWRYATCLADSADFGQSGFQWQHYKF